MAIELWCELLSHHTSYGKYALENTFERDHCVRWHRIELGAVPVTENKAHYEGRFSTASILGIMVFGSVGSQHTFAKNILWVIMTKNELHVSPHFPISLMFLPEAFGLDHRVPKKNIIDVRETSSSLLGRRVVVKYRHATADEEHLELWVNDIPTLMRALADLRQ